MKTLTTLQTVLHAYNLNTRDPEAAAKYAAIVAERTAAGVKLFAGASVDGLNRERKIAAALDGKTVTLELEHIFNNQWDTAAPENFRVFDWHEAINIDSRAHKVGHYLEITEEMRAVRATTCKCGYCGAQYENTAPGGFCNHCIDSEYLKFAEFHLLRLAPVAADESKPRAPLDDAEKAHWLPIYKSAQQHGSTARGIARIAKRRAAVAATYEKIVAGATAERDGLVWLMDHGVMLEPIYYNHTGRFCFGWNSPIDVNVVDDLRASLAGFPFPFDIK